MPELPEVEIVRRGLAAQITGRPIAAVEVRHPRAVRRSPTDLSTELPGCRVRCVSRRGKYLWMPLEPPDGCVDGHALVAHLGMSGQFRVHDQDREPTAHVRARFDFADGGPALSFVDQRTFGGLFLDVLVDDGTGGRLPRSLAHVARDLFDPAFDDDACVTRLRARNTEVKRALLDQALVSGIGNIYADEALWRARLHGRRTTARLTRAQGLLVLTEARAVMRAALAEGGTSFDALYVNVNGTSGYFERSLQAYGRAGQACRRCGATIRREAFMNRSSFWCPRCQPAPRAPRGAAAAG